MAYVHSTFQQYNTYVRGYLFRLVQFNHTINQLIHWSLRVLLLMSFQPVRLELGIMKGFISKKRLAIITFVAFAVMCLISNLFEIKSIKHLHFSKTNFEIDGNKYISNTSNIIDDHIIVHNYSHNPVIFMHNDQAYAKIMATQFNDYYNYINRKQHPQVSFADVNSSKDVILMFEDKNQFRLFWGEPDFSNAILSFRNRQIPCDHYGVRTCTITYEREYLERADAVVQIAAFNWNQAPTVSLKPHQSFIGYYTEADDSGCQKRMFHAKLSYSPDATIRFNDHCSTVRLMYQCMSKIIRVLSRKKGLNQRQINRWKRKMYQYCVTHSSASGDELESNVTSYVRNEIGDVAMFVSNCAMPRSNYIKALVDASDLSKTFKVNSYGKCYRNIQSSDDKITAGYKHKFLFAMENKLKMDYVSEKIFQAYRTGTVPIYQGSPNIFDYAPSSSFVGLHVAAKPQELIDHISYLLKNESAYDEYFNWDFDEWIKKPHTIQCLQIEAEDPIDAGWCSICDWVVNISPKWKQQGLNNCDKSEYAPYFGYPRNSFKYKAKYN